MYNRKPFVSALHLVCMPFKTRRNFPSYWRLRVERFGLEITAAVVYFQFYSIRVDIYLFDRCWVNFSLFTYRRHADPEKWTEPLSLLATDVKKFKSAEQVVNEFSLILILFQSSREYVMMQHSKKLRNNKVE